MRPFTSLRGGEGLYFVRFVLFCTDAVNDFLDKNCPYVAAAISFYALFSFFPLVLAIVSIYGCLTLIQCQ